MIVFLLCLASSLISGCYKEKETEESKVIEGSKQDASVADNIEEKFGSDMETRRVTIYFVDDASAEVVGEGFDIENEYDIWKILQEKGILTEGCELLSMKINEKEKKIDLDFNNATGERIRSMGTTGETEIIGCIINTYLGAYSCKQIKLTENGESFQTSHGAIFQDYTGWMSFEG